MHVPGYEAPIEFGVLHCFAYKLADSLDHKQEEEDAEIVVATTRPETMLGDVAVAVHPSDVRYRKFHGRALRHPFVPDRKMRVIVDAELVNPEFGTGAVKITPAHDGNDFECGKRHGLPMVNVLDEAGRINENGGPYRGKPRFEVLFVLGWNWSPDVCAKLIDFRQNNNRHVNC